MPQMGAGLIFFKTLCKRPSQKPAKLAACLDTTI